MYWWFMEGDPFAISIAEACGSGAAGVRTAVTLAAESSCTTTRNECVFAEWVMLHAQSEMVW